MDKKKVIPLCLATMIAASTFSGCSSQEEVNTSNTDDDNPSDSDTLTNVTQTQEAYLAVDPNKCIGCGKCVKFDSEHFVMSGVKSTVISQENLGSDDLQTAIDRCPADAITL